MRRPENSVRFIAAPAAIEIPHIPMWILRVLVSIGMGFGGYDAAMPSGKRLVGRAQAVLVDRIRAEMVGANGMKQSELARRAETTLSKIFNGASVLDVEQTAAIAAVFGLKMWELAIPPPANHVGDRCISNRRRRAYPHDRDDVDIDWAAGDLGL